MIGKMKPKRLREWWRVVEFEAQLDVRPWWRWEQEEQDRFARIVTRMATAWVFGRGRVDGAVWRARLRICRRCPVYEREWRQCRLGEHGCGCYVPFVALVKAPYPSGCWWREAVGDSGGWPAV